MKHPLATALCAASVAAVTPALAVEWYLQPIALISAETDSNVDLDTGHQPEVQGYVADLATIVGIDTPEWQTVIRPRVVYRDYPQDSGDDRLEGYLDFNSVYKTQRSQATVSGSFLHLDEFNAEYTDAVFNDINPVQGAPDTGRTVVGATRDSGVVSPKYVYNFTPTVSAGASGQYQIVTYSPADDTSHLDFDYYQARAFVTYSLSPREDLSFGGFGSKFSTKDVFSQATGSGALVDLNSQWTPLFSTTTELIYQHTKIDTAIPEPLTGEVNKLGGSIDASYKTEVERFRLIARRSVSPSGGGGVYDTDRLQFQYDRTFSPRFSMTGAVVGIKTRALTAGIEGDNRTYAQALVEAHYALTQRFFVQGGYQYAHQKYEFDPDSATNNRIYIEFGYTGLGQQR